ncbi:MAG: hypothetical protein QHJ82_15620 [Verrucomicrobiota bacterium]|nr:hypothetical protein [Verrucomicrobiota bacterium]
MTRKAQILVLFTAVLGSFYIYYFTDWLNAPTIQILKLDRPVPYGRSTQAALPVTFTLEDRYRLTEIKVVPVDALATNRNPTPLWHLISKSNSLPTKGFAYGQPIRGMQPASDKARPQPLRPGVTYRLYVKAGRARGEIDFQGKPASANN